MKKTIIILLLTVPCFFISRADHITGGEMFYKYDGFANQMHKYRFTLKFYMRCNSGRQFSNPVIIAIFDKSSSARIGNLEVPLASTETLNRVDDNECITNPPTVCYELGYYYFDLSLPESISGYVVAAQVNYRINGINNLQPGYNNIGATYTAEIPGKEPQNGASVNISARFVGSDMVVVCENNSFSYSFGAVDDDNDELRYFFCDAYRSAGGGAGPNNSTPPPPPPYNTVPYASPNFNGSAPLGNQVKIDPETGLITGIAPASGVYVVTVCVQELRNGKVIATQRKDLQINITACSIIAASLPDEFLACKESKTVTFTNSFVNPQIKSYTWELTSLSGEPIFNSNSPGFTYSFKDTGLYKIRLIINRTEQCSDSASSLVRVYPGFKPDFSAQGICFSKSTLFTDATTSVYGKVNSWQWEFGEPSVNTDRSEEQNPQYTYPVQGSKYVTLITTDTKGCRDTLHKTINIVNKPPLLLAFTDTLICKNDAVQLQGQASGAYSWSPAVNIINSTSPSPVVTPQVTTVYYADYNENGCINRDSVLVRVTDRVNLQVMNDTTICEGDTIRLRINSDALQYTWAPASQTLNAAIAQPLVITGSTTTYVVTANIGSCVAKESVNVFTVPYPEVNAGADTMICFNTSALLQGSSNGSTVQWQPSSGVSNTNALNTTVLPPRTTEYFLFAWDTKGCPKPGIDSKLVTVLPPVYASAGNDTSVVVGQPLQLQASGGINYLWNPAVSLSSADIPNPVAVYTTPSDGIQYQVMVSNEAGCTEYAYVKVKIFKEGPVVYVPTAFTPNGDGLNDLIRPIAAGMQKMEYFRIYNRWGKLIFSTAEDGKGWDGRISGQLQGSDTFVWAFRAIDFKGEVFVKKGTFTLIR